MRKRCLLYPLFLLVLSLFAPHALAGEVESGNWEYDDAKHVFSCDLNLSGADMGGQVFAALFAESGQAKSVTAYPAAGTVHIDLPGTDTTDYIRVAWTDSRYAPVAEPAVMRMRDNGKKAHAEFENELRKARHDDLIQAGDPTRLLVSSSQALPWEEYGVENVIAGANNFYVLDFLNHADAKACKEKLKALPCVRYAEFDDVIKLEVEDTDAVLLDGESRTPPFSWGVPETGIGEYAADLKKRGIDKEIVVAVVDTGVDSGHEFLTGRVLAGYDFAENDATPQDESGHGTHVAGIIADCTPGMNVKILPVRVLDKYGHSTPLKIRRGIEYAVERGAHIINLSLGYSEEKPPIEEAIQAAISEYNITVVVAACNDNADAGEYCPANIGKCITVAAMQKDTDKLSRWGRSNYGKVVDIAAPGGKVYSCIPKGRYETFSGTSMAAPHVSAAAALLMCERGTGQTPNQIQQTLKNAADTLPEDTRDDAWKFYKRDNPGATWADFLGAGFLDMRPFMRRTVTFRDNSGTGTMAPWSVSHGTTILLPEWTYTRTGYSFDGWNTQADGQGRAYAAGASLTVTDDLTLYAQWKEIGFYALLYADGEFVFQKSDTPAPGKSLLDAYPVAVADGGAQYAPWYENRSAIRTVTIADTLQPRSTALWFHGCDNLTEIRGLERLDTSQVTDMSQMFARCAALATLDLTALNTSGVTNMRQMFNNCSALATLDLTGWNTANVSNMSDMFNGCTALKTVYASDSFTTGKASNSAGMFGGCTALVGQRDTKYDPAHTDKAYARIDGGTSAPGYFTDKNAPTPPDDVYAILYSDGELVFQHGHTPKSGKTVTKTYEVDLNAIYIEDDRISLRLIPWYNERESVRVVNFVDKVSPTATAAWFYDCSYLERVDNIRNLDTSNVTDMRGMFFYCSELTALDVSHFDTANVTNMYAMFADCSGLTALDVSHFDTANVTYMDQMFDSCKGLTALDVSHFDTANVTSMAGMFRCCSGLTALDVSHFDTANVTSMGGMFDGCSSLTALDVSHFDTAKVQGMGSMFNNCKKLTALDVSHFDTANVTSMAGMFIFCSGLTALDVSHFDTANVQDMYEMFSGCSSLTALDVSHFDTANVTSMHYMFSGCSSLKTIYASDKFTTVSVTTDSGMFNGCTSLIGGSGTKFNSAHVDKAYARIDDGTSAPGYFTRK